MEKPNIYLSGSRSMPWLDVDAGSSDVDLIIYSKHILPRVEKDVLMEDLQERYSSLGNLDFHFIAKDCEKYLWMYNHFCMEELEHNQDLPLPDLAEFREYILKECLWYVRESVYRTWYHCLYNICMYENWDAARTYDLTEEQKAEVNDFYKNKRVDSGFFTGEMRDSLLSRINVLLSKNDTTGQ